MTYLDAYESQAPDQPWVNYYRASSLLKLNRPQEALVATENDALRNPDCPFIPVVHRAAAFAALENEELFREHLSDVLAVKLSDVDYLTTSGIHSLFSLLWTTVENMDTADPLRRQFEDLLVSASIAPEDMLSAHREIGEPVEGVNFYVCVVKQPLDQRWQEWPGRLPGEEDFESYLVSWGVLARTVEEASELVLKWQKRAYPLIPIVEEINCRGVDYCERIGVVWQGERVGK